MHVSSDRIRDDFDRIALLVEQHGETGDLYNRWLERRLPSRCGDALEIGCGSGAFTRLLATGSRHVDAVDLSPRMIRLARERSSAYDNIDYSVEDVTELSLPSGRYDCIVSLATLHHLPLDDTILRLRDALAPGGTLLIHDLTADDGIVDLILTAIALPISRTRKLWTTGRLRMPREVRDAWREHGDRERYLTMREVRSMARKLLPGAEVHRHLMWRYTVVWRKGVRSQELE